MKILVFSDVHGNQEQFKDLLSTHEDAQYVISLGDSELKHHVLQHHDIIAVKGNYPFDAGIGYKHVCKIDGWVFLLTHGHKERIKHGYETLYYAMLEAEADVAFYGHTHIPDFKHISGKYIINPGAVHRPRTPQGPSYLVLDLEKESIVFQWYHAKTHEVLSTKQIEKKHTD